MGPKKFVEVKFFTIDFFFTQNMKMVRTTSLIMLCALFAI